MAAEGGNQHHGTTRGLISMRELLDQVDINKKHFMRSSKSLPELSSLVGSGSPSRAFSVSTSLPPVRELDNDPDTFMFLCLPYSVISLEGLRRRIWRCISNLLWTRPPLPCVTTTCGPVHHVRGCKFHPLSDGLPYNMAIRSSTSLPSFQVQRSKSLPEYVRSSSSLSAPLLSAGSSSDSPSTSSASTSSSEGS